MKRPEKRANLDYVLLIVLVMLIGAGLVLLYSTSAYNGQNKFQDAYYYVKKQGAATNTQMTVKQISQARETQSYPQQGIRSCNAIVETNGVKYVTDYSIILNDKGFFVQVENAQPAQRF